jgi:hypothetical protein
VQAAAALGASGEELVRIIEAVVARLTQLLSLESCSFEATAADPVLERISREGEIVAPAGLRTAASRDGERRAELPVIVQGTDLGYFLLTFAKGAPPSPERLRVAVTLSDHVGAAFLAQAPPPPPEDPVPRLRVLSRARLTTATPVAVSPGTQETAGFSSRRERMIS